MVNGMTIEIPRVIGGVRIETPQLRAVLRKTGAHLGMVGVHATRIDEAIAHIVEATAGALEHLAEYNRLYGGPPHSAGLAQLGGSALRSASDFKLAVGRIVARRLSAIGVDVHQADGVAGETAVRPLVDRTFGLSLLALAQNWRNAPELSMGEDPDEDAA